MEEAHCEVRDWFEGLFSSKTDLPGYEVTSETVSALHKVATWNISRDSELDALMQSYRQQIQDYSEAAERMSSVLEPLGLAATSTQIKTLSELSLSLGLDDPNEDSLRLASTQRKAGAIFEAVEIGQTKEREFPSLRDLSNLRCLSGSVEESLGSLPPLSSVSDSKKDFLFKKHKEYKALGEKYRKAYKKHIPSHLMTHAGILGLKDETGTLEKEVGELENRLKSYHELPPSLELAELKVQEAKLKLLELDEDIQKNFNLK